ncbi:GD24104 [Drosophila simulans]|uniref:GD24104 n=1 Tax=Drosophila simulans TaxID=7240 RepID=B4Q7W5_DROSI|nr:GD24104 [Drosophila simulans]
MPEKGHEIPLRKSRKKWLSRILRWSVSLICWISYIIYRGVVVGQIKFDARKVKMVIHPRNIWTKRIALLLKILTLLWNYSFAQYLCMAFLPILPNKSGRLFDNLIDAIAVQLSLWNTARLYSWLNSLSWNRSFVDRVNDVIRVNAHLNSILGPLSLDGISLLILYVVHLQFTLLQTINHSYLVPMLNTLLLGLICNVYVAYQMLLLSWIAAINHFLKDCQQEQQPNRKQRKKLLRLLRIYAKISNVHQDIKVLWLPVASMLFSNIVELVRNWSYIIEWIFFHRHKTVMQKWSFVFWRYLGSGFAPLLMMLLIGLCNDRLVQMQDFLNLQLLIIDLRHTKLKQLDGNFVSQLFNLQTCFDLQLRAQPIRNQIMSVNQECGCPFALDFFFCTVLNSISCVQYKVANGINSD